MNNKEKYYNQPWCPRCRWATIHNIINWVYLCTKCWDRNAVTLKRAMGKDIKKESQKKFYLTREPK